MAKQYVLDEQTMNELETLSANYEQLKNFIGVLHWHIWQNVIEGSKAALPDNIEKAGTLISALVDVAAKREDDLETIIKKIDPLT